MRTAPNILLIMVDELAPQVLPMHGHPVVRATQTITNRSS